MLMCWNEEPQKRPKFTDLRARFDAMLLAERKDAYIDLHIDTDKPYYRLDTMATVAATTNGLHLLSPNPDRRSFNAAPCSMTGSKPNSKDCSPTPTSHTPNLSPCHKIQPTCCSSANASPRKSDASGNVSQSLSFFIPSPYHESREHNQTSSDTETNERERLRDGYISGRPVSLLLPHDGERERRERQNPYVDEPSRLAATALLLLQVPGSSAVAREHTSRGSDHGAMELNQLRPCLENGEPEVQITITGD